MKRPLRSRHLLLILVATAAPPAREAPLYRLRDSKEETCILLEVDGLLVFTYKTTVDEERETDRFIPEEVATSGTCDEDSATLVLQWGSYKLLWDFFKTPGGEKWYVDRIELTFNTSEKIFEHTKIPGRVLTLSTPRNHRVLLFPTPVGWSFTCKKETPIDLSDHDDFSATLLLREFHLQPFIFKGDDFGPEHECSARGIGALIDETAPIAVGSTLAIVVLLTVTVYGIFRYFKVKKVQYDTME
ncbi:lysosome-associated membrane glycoprotein 3 isoform X2 [Bacillus rossius redtenbacheri]|uniref:lysosome-associated membrane glycoprotein 3 isoform X2 n=1 Tax=Bacillus rossius redtenbacheri TaxID=93214 RepID=UPI002FDDFBDF